MKKLHYAISLTSLLACLSTQAAIISNGDLNTAVSQGGTGNGNTAFGIDSGPVTVNSWLWTNIGSGFTYSSTGGNSGGAFTQASPNGTSLRAVAQFAQDDSLTTGPVDISMDVFFSDADALSPLSFQVELYAWNSGETGATLSMGGGAGTTYNATNLNDSVALIDNISINASSYADSTWNTVTIASSLDLGTGYDFYAWRIGAANKDSADAFAFDNLTVTATVPEPATFALFAGIACLALTMVRQRKK